MNPHQVLHPSPRSLPPSAPPSLSLSLLLSSLFVPTLLLMQRLGLDATVAYDVMYFLKQVAKECNMTVIVVLHQPRFILFPSSLSPCFSLSPLSPLLLISPSHFCYLSVFFSSELKYSSFVMIFCFWAREDTLLVSFLLLHIICIFSFIVFLLLIIYCCFILYVLFVFILFYLFFFLLTLLLCLLTL